MGNKAQELTRIMQVLDNNVSIGQSSTEVDKGVAIRLIPRNLFRDEQDDVLIFCHPLDHSCFIY